jgi:hypothetical protein
MEFRVYGVLAQGRLEAELQTCQNVNRFVEAAL